MTRFGFGAWLSPVERCVRVAEVPGSNPGAPIMQIAQAICLRSAGRMVLHSPRKRAPERAWGFESLALRFSPLGLRSRGLLCVWKQGSPGVSSIEYAFPQFLEVILD